MRSNSLASAVVAGIAVAALSGFSATARADTVFNFTYSDSASTFASGTLVASDNGGGVFTAYSGVLTITTGPLAGTYSLLANAGAPNVTTSPQGAFNYDNQLFASQDPHLDGWGLLFVGGPDPLNHSEVNIWGNFVDNYSGYTHGISGYDYTNEQAHFNLTAVPIPSAAWMGMAGLTGAFGIGQARRRATRIQRRIWPTR